MMEALVAPSLAQWRMTMASGGRPLHAPPTPSATTWLELWSNWPDVES